MRSSSEMVEVDVDGGGDCAEAKAGGSVDRWTVAVAVDAERVVVLRNNAAWANDLACAGQCALASPAPRLARPLSKRPEFPAIGAAEQLESAVVEAAREDNVPREALEEDGTEAAALPAARLVLEIIPAQRSSVPRFSQAEACTKGEAREEQSGVHLFRASARCDA